MSRSPESSRRRDEGFSLLEIIVSIGVISVVMMALLPQLVSGIKSTGTARLVTQAKGVAQGQLERMRSLPFHVAPAAGDYRDVLDFHFRNLVTPSTAPVCKTGGTYAVPQAGWTGYVPAGATRCDYEPASGPMYRYVGPSTAEGFRVVVSTQFLSGVTPPAPVLPPAGYDTQTTGKDRPAASQIGVTVTVLYSDRGTLRPVSTYTQLSERPVTTSRIKATAQATALEVGSVAVGKGSVSLAAGMLSLGGTLTYSSNATANLSAISAGYDSGEQGSGASVTLVAPPARSTADLSVGAGWLGSSCDFVCWGPSHVDQGAMSSEGGLPNVGSAADPMQSLLTTADPSQALRFHNSTTLLYRPSLKLSGPLVRVDESATAAASGLTTACGAGNTGAASYITASGYITTSETAVEACAVARTSSISLFPTTFAPRGVVVIELEKVSARCMVAGTSHTPTVVRDYRAVVKHYDPSLTTDDKYTVAGVITPSLTADPLSEVSMDTVVGDNGETLGRYISSWAAVLPTGAVPTTANKVASVKIPGVLTISTQPVRVGTDVLTGSGALVDLASAVSLTFGAVGCSAEDAR